MFPCDVDGPVLSDAVFRACCTERGPYDDCSPMRVLG